MHRDFSRQVTFSPEFGRWQVMSVLTEFSVSRRWNQKIWISRWSHRECARTRRYAGFGEPWDNDFPLAPERMEEPEEEEEIIVLLGVGEKELLQAAFLQR